MSFFDEDYLQQQVGKEILKNARRKNSTEDWIRSLGVLVMSIVATCLLIFIFSMRG